MDALTARRIIDRVLVGEEIERGDLLEIGGDVLMRRLLDDLASRRDRVGCLPAGSMTDGELAEIALLRRRGVPVPVSGIFRDVCASRLRVLSLLRRGEIVSAGSLRAASWPERLASVPETMRDGIAEYQGWTA